MVSLQGSIDAVTKTAFQIAAFLGVADTKGKQVPQVIAAYEKNEGMDVDTETLDEENFDLPSVFSIRLLAQKQIMNWIIGKGGGQIRKIQEENNVELTVDADSGLVK